MKSVRTINGGLFIDTAAPLDEFEECQNMIYGDDNDWQDDYLYDEDNDDDLSDDDDYDDYFDYKHYDD